MDGECRRTFEMAVRVDKFDTAHPADDEGQALSEAKVKELTAKMTQVAGDQRAGVLDSKAASTEKAKLSQAIRSGPMAHLRGVGRLAAREVHELGTVFRYRPDMRTFVSVLSVGRSMQSEAETHKPVLMKYGLSEPVLAQLGQLLDRLEAAMTLGSDGRSLHIAATRQLTALSAELKRVVRVMDARNRQRFENDPQLLSSWITASTVARGRRSDAPPESEGTPEAGGDVRPAA